MDFIIKRRGLTSQPRCSESRRMGPLSVGLEHFINNKNIVVSASQSLVR